MQTQLPFEVILRLYGYAIGVLIQFIMLVLLRHYYRVGVLERRLFLFFGTIFVWFFSNFMALSLKANFVLNPKWWYLNALYQLFESLSFLSIALLPSLLLACHLHLQNRLVPKSPAQIRKGWEMAIFLPILGAPLPYLDLLELFKDESNPARGFSFYPAAAHQAESQLFGTSLFACSSYAPYFAAWSILVLSACVLIEWRISKELAQPSARKMFFGLMLVFVALASLLAVIYFLSPSYGNLLSERRWLEACLRLWPALPGGITGYYILRYNFLGFTVQRRLIYLAAFFMGLLVYQLLKDHLAYRYYIYPFTLDFTTVFLVLIFFRPVKNLLDRLSNSLFSEEISRIHKITSWLEEASRATTEIGQLLPSVENLLQRELEISQISIHLFGPQTELASRMNFKPSGGMHQLGLYKGEVLIGEILMECEDNPSGAHKLESLRALAASIVTAVENCRLAEEKIRLEKELAGQEKFAALGQMAATVAHNIKNPLSSIKTLVQLLQEDPAVAGPYDRDLNMMNNEIDRLSSSVSQLLKFSKTPVIDLVSLDIREILDLIGSLFSTEAQKRGIRLEMDGPDIGLMVRGNREILQEILQNLVVNAMEAISRDGVILLTAWMKKSAGRNWAMVSVEDNGNGVPPEIQGNLFRPFFTTKPKGSGLGLSIVQRRVLELGGQIECVSPVLDGRGARFEISFPALQRASEGTWP
jgi:signal transduction histidine kinase